MFEFSVTAKLSGRGRTGLLHTPHGDIRTPMFMPVGTQASIKSLSPADLESIGAQIILANNYHLYLRPGSEVIHKLGGIHKFMAWPRPILTDSGGFQVFSLNRGKGADPDKKSARSRTPLAGVEHGFLPGRALIKISNDGIFFTSHLDGSQHFWSPEDAIRSQVQIGADIIMPLDHCTSDLATHKDAQEAMHRTHNWLVRCKNEWLKSTSTLPLSGSQALYGIIQGGQYQDLRRQSAEFIVSQDLPGIAIGGESIGYNMDRTEEIMDWIIDLLPENKPRYTMGLGLRPSDLVRAVNHGVDMFDCVAPTRLARNGALYVSTGISANERIDISKTTYQVDDTPIDPNCDCPACQNFTRAYLHHLFKAKELLYYRLASLHNLRFMIKTAGQIT